MTSEDREEQRVLLEHVGKRHFEGPRRDWCIVAIAHAIDLDRIFESAAYAWTDGPEDES